MSQEVRKGYKAFDFGMKCRGKQYAENTIFEEQGAKDCCEAGVMHYCENPLDVLNYYPLIDGEGRVVEIAEVAPLAEVLRKDDKCATKKLKIGAKIRIGNLVEIAGEYLRENIKGKEKDAAVGGDPAKQVGGYYAKQEAGRNSVIMAGSGSTFKAGLHSVILHYWYDDDYNIVGFKAAQVDGEKIKADTWYKLVDGEFVEV